MKSLRAHYTDACSRSADACAAVADSFTDGSSPRRRAALRVKWQRAAENKEHLARILREMGEEM